MTSAKLARALLATTWLVAASLAWAGDDDRSGAMDMHHAGAMPAQLCAAGHQHHTEAFDPIKAATTAPVMPDKPPLWDNLGDLHWTVTTNNGAAQDYFDQGLRLTYAFNHGEARRAFRVAQAADPNCAMCYWGEALVLGPNINYPMQPDAIEPAFAASAKAQALADRASSKEQALIRAVAKRYSPEAKADRHALDGAYADEMTAVAGSFPDDDNIQALFAESLMDLSPWDYWQADAATPKAGQARLSLRSKPS